MLVLTSNALTAGTVPPGLLPDWPGPHVVVILPDSGISRARVSALSEQYIVIERLIPAVGLHEILADIARFVPDRLRTDEGPLLCLDRAPQPEDRALEAGGVGSLAVEVLADPDGSVVRALIGDLISTSPLFPRFFSMVAKLSLSDAAFFKLLTESFVWEAA